METLFELLIRNIVINFLGINIRYYFLKFLKKDIRKKDLESNQYDVGNSFQQGFYNLLIGIIGFIILALLIVYLLYILNLL